MKHNGRKLITRKEAAKRLQMSIPTFLKRSKEWDLETEPPKRIKGIRTMYYADQFATKRARATEA